MWFSLLKTCEFHCLGCEHLQPSACYFLRFQRRFVGFVNYTVCLNRGFNMLSTSRNRTDRYTSPFL